MSSKNMIQHYILCGVWIALLCFGYGTAATTIVIEKDGEHRGLTDQLKLGGKGKKRNPPNDEIAGRPVSSGLGTLSMSSMSTKSRAHQNQCARMMADHMPAMKLKSLSRGRTKAKAKTSKGRPGTSAAAAKLADGSLSSEVGTNDSAPVAFCDSATSSAATINGDFPCHEVDLMSFIAMRDLSAAYGDPDDNANDMWGWSSGGREFALVGTFQGTAFIEITQPTNPVVKGVLPNLNNFGQPTGSTWGDVKTFQNYAYIVSEADDQGLQIFDLNQLLTPDSVQDQVFTETAHFGGFKYAHNIVINEDSGTAFAVGSDMCGGGLYMLDLNQDPEVPQPYDCITQADGNIYGYVDGSLYDYSYTHDAHCVIYNGPDASYSGKELCFACNEDRVTIFDITNKSAVTVISEFTYMSEDPYEQSYTHQGWLTEDHAYFLFGDELDEYFSAGAITTTTYILDVSQLTSPTLKGEHRGDGYAIDHNLYIKKDYVYQANYRAGFQVFHLTDLSQGILTKAGHFDIFPRNDAARFNGAWSVYPFFPSGMVAISGIEQGLYVFNPKIPNSEPDVSEDTFDWVLLNSSDFEGSSWGIWNDGGENAKTKVLDGDGAICLLGNTASSKMDATINVSNSRKLKVKFSFYPREMTNGDKLELLLSTGGSSSTTGSYESGVDFRKHERYIIEQELSFPSPNPTSAQLQFKFQGSSLDDSISIFDVSIYGEQVVSP